MYWKATADVVAPEGQRWNDQHSGGGMGSLHALVIPVVLRLFKATDRLRRGYLDSAEDENYYQQPLQCKRPWLHIKGMISQPVPVVPGSQPRKHSFQENFVRYRNVPLAVP
ncbi:hypothetical protein DLREEDagrD3_05770 [Denitratisoma sp. agr-D3]